MDLKIYLNINNNNEISKFKTIRMNETILVKIIV